ncbi:unnamed protein product [Schistosoma turkestanicum]|nr:unnamed protein product [Schistosoma turkestanicum]
MFVVLAAESEMSTPKHKKKVHDDDGEEEDAQEEQVQVEEQEQPVSKKNKDKKAKHPSKSIRSKKPKEKHIKEPKDTTATSTATTTTATTTTVTAQIHATDSPDGMHTDTGTTTTATTNTTTNTTTPATSDVKNTDKLLKKLKSPKRIKISSKKSKTTDDENDTSTMKKKKFTDKLKDKNKNKTNKSHEDDDNDAVSSVPVKDNQNKKIHTAEERDVETDEMEELELEDEEPDLEDNINQVQPFDEKANQHSEEDEEEEEDQEEKIELIEISSQSAVQVNSEIPKRLPTDVSSPELAESVKKETTDLFYRSIRQWIGDDDDDLPFDSGETLKILEKDDDGWWLGENVQGKQGLVPMNFLKKIVMLESEWKDLKLNYIKQKTNETIPAEVSPQTYSEADEEDEEQQEEVARQATKLTNAVNEQKVSRESTKVQLNETAKENSVVNQIPGHTEDSAEYDDKTWEEGEGDETSENFEIEEQREQQQHKDEDDLIHKEGDVGVIEESRVSVVHSSNMTYADKISTSISFLDTEKWPFKDEPDYSSWYIKNNEKALEAYQPLPSSVRLSFLSSPGLASYNYQKFLSPKLGSSHLIFTDLLLDTDRKQITRRQPRWQKIMTIQKITQLSLLEESNLSILNCLIRLCLFDGTNPISNIYCLPIIPTDREKKTWIVAPHNIKKPEKMYELSSDLFVRYNDQNMNSCILLEIQLIVSKQNSNQPIELSLGWITIPLYDENGQIIANKTCDYRLQDSLPFENGKGNKTATKDVSLKSRMQNLLFNKATQVTIRFSQPNKEQQDKLDSLPDIFVGLMAYTSFFSYHRDFLANIFPGFGRTDDKDQFVLRHVQPEIALFPVVADCPLLIECLRVTWQDRLKTIPNNNKKDSQYLKKLYSDHFRRVIYPLLWLQEIQFPNVMSPQQFENETPKLLNLIEQIRQDFVKFITSTKYKFKLFTSKEFTCPIQFTN